MTAAINRFGTRAVAAISSVVVVALVTGCESSSAQVRVENHCEVAIQVSYSALVIDERQDVASPDVAKVEVVADAAIDVAAGASSTLKPDLNGAGDLVIRGHDGAWLNVAPLESGGATESDGFIKDGVFLVDGVLCAQLEN